MRGDRASHGSVNGLPEFFPCGLSVLVELHPIDLLLPHFGSANVKHASVIKELVGMIEDEDMTGEAVFVPTRAGVVPKETRFPSGAFLVEQGGYKADSVDSFLRGNLGFAQLG